MKNANKYSLKIQYTDGKKFHATILAISAEAATTWLPRTEQTPLVQSLNLTLLTTGHNVRETFCAADITGQDEKEVQRYYL